MKKFLSLLHEFWWWDLFRDKKHPINLNDPVQERKVLKQFLGLCTTILILTWMTTFIQSFYGQQDLSKQRNPFEKTPKPTMIMVSPTPYPTFPPYKLTPTSSRYSTQSATLPSQSIKKACPSYALLCPDKKTYVHAVGPACEFQKCPTPQ